MRKSWKKWILSLLGLAVVLPFLRSQGQEPGYIEDFSLAADRTKALAQLIPGTEDYYYYHCLNALNLRQFEKLETYTKPWVERFGQTPRYHEIQTRSALLSYEKDPKKTFDYLRNRIGAQYPHQKEIVGLPPGLPTILDPKLIGRDRFLADSLARWPNLDNFEDSSFDWLSSVDLNWEKRRNLLQRVVRPDVPNLVQMLLDDDQQPHPQAFGAYPVSRQLTLAQLEELVAKRPSWLNQPAMVQTWLPKLQPGSDSNWRRSPAEQIAYLDRLWSFAKRLDPVNNPLKAHVLFHRLVVDRSQGKWDKERFLTYLALPRIQGYMARTINESEVSQRFPARLDADYSGQTLFPPVFSDEELVRSYLKRFLVEAETQKEFEPFIDGDYLRHLFAEVKVENGLGDPERWASLLPPEAFKALKERVDLDFAPTNKTDFAEGEPVVLEMFTKNVPSLMVKVFEVNTGNFYRANLREIDTDINLDGLIANQEKTVAYDDSPLRRVARKFEFPIDKPGVYIVDFIGSGKSSRALIRKGKLHALVNTTTAGQAVSIFDENRLPVKDATVWLAGKEYTPVENGTVLLPFTNEPGRRQIVLSRGGFSSLEAFQHQSEDYQFQAGLYVDRESLLSQKMATLMIRPGLRLSGVPVSLKLLEKVQLRITSTDANGINTTTDFSDLVLAEDREMTQNFRVPEGTSRLEIRLSAEVKNLSKGTTQPVSATQVVDLNGILKTEKIEDIHLIRSAEGITLETLGRTGEPRPDRAIQVRLKHRDFREMLSVSLKSDPKGRVHLGPLPDITQVQATGSEGVVHSWNLSTNQATLGQMIHGIAGAPVVIPYLGKLAQADRSEFSLFEMVGGLPRTDRFAAIQLADGMIKIQGLEPGDYELWIKPSSTPVRIRIVQGVTGAEHVLGEARSLRVLPLKPLQLGSMKVEGGDLVIKVENANAFSRVHLFGTRYQPGLSAFGQFNQVRSPELDGVFPAVTPSVYVTGRNIGDEYRYVLDRRNQRKFPGVMLERPTLLLNPWAVRETTTGEQVAQVGQAFEAKGDMQASRSDPGLADRTKAGEATVDASAFADLDFLARGTSLVSNLVPDKDGLVRIPLKELGDHGFIQAVACDPLQTVTRSLTLPLGDLTLQDQRLRKGLDPAGKFLREKKVSVLTKGEPFGLDDIRSSKFEIYDSLAKAHTLFFTLNKDAALNEFSFLMRWPGLKPEEKKTLLSKYGCHELHFFLYQKDRAFFDEVVKPFLANKKDKTFIDLWLLGADLNQYLAPWEYSRLNTMERVLLAKRIQEESPNTARHLDERLRLIPPNIQNELVQFDTAVTSTGLASGGDNLSELRKKVELEGLKEGQGKGKPVPGDMGGGGKTPFFLENLNDADMARDGAPGREAPRKAGGDMKPGKPAESQSERGLAPELRSRQLKSGLDEFAAKKQILNKRESDKAGLSLDTVDSREMKPEAFYKNTRQTQGVAQLYRPIETTKEYAENNYRNLPIASQNADLVGPGAFWLDYVKHDGKTPFLSKNLAAASRNFTESIFALAITDLPFEAGKHDLKYDGGKLTVHPASPAIAFHEEVRIAEIAQAQAGILVSQNMYKLGERFKEENGEKLDKFVTGEFIAQTAYGCQIVVTNPTSSRRKVTLLIQVPVGSIPLTPSQATRSIPLDLEPYRTHTLDYSFYFPVAGKYGQLPVQVSEKGKSVDSALATAFAVVDKPTRTDTASWDHISQNGTDKEVLDFLARENLQALNLDKIAFRMKDPAFYGQVTALLASRHVYQNTLWSYGLLHGEPKTAQEFLKHNDTILNDCAGPIQSPLLTVDPVARFQYEHLEYKPLVNARAHALGAKRQIVNDRLAQQYRSFLKLLSYQRELGDGENLSLVIYLLQQDRIEEAAAAFAKVDPAKVPSKLPYDYAKAWLMLATEQPAKAREIAQPHTKHPVDRWRDAFVRIIDQVNEAEGKDTVKAVDPENRAEVQDKLAATEPTFEFVVEGSKLMLSWQNLKEVTVNHYLMDVELLFSRNPFVQQSGGEFAFIKPNQTKVIKLPDSKGKIDIGLPADLAKRNLLVEITVAGKTRTAAYYSSAMDVKLFEGQGQLKVTARDAATPLPKVYVKVYARIADGSVKFHKDGYTDLRGRFDYATVSTPEKQPTTRYAILVLSEEHGAGIREVAPPQR